MALSLFLSHAVVWESNYRAYKKERLRLLEAGGEDGENSIMRASELSGVCVLKSQVWTIPDLQIYSSDYSTRLEFTRLYWG